MLYRAVFRERIIILKFGKLYNKSLMKVCTLWYFFLKLNALSLWRAFFIRFPGLSPNLWHILVLLLPTSSSSHIFCGIATFRNLQPMQVIHIWTPKCLLNSTTFFDVFHFHNVSCKIYYKLLWNFLHKYVWTLCHLHVIFTEWHIP